MIQFIAKVSSPVNSFLPIQTQTPLRLPLWMDVFNHTTTENALRIGVTLEHNNNDIVALPAPDIEIIHHIIYGSASLGLLGAAFIIITFLLFKEIRLFSTKLIFFLSLSDFMASLCWFPFGNVNDFLCLVQAMGLQFFLGSSLLWTMCISLSLMFAFYADKFETFELSQNMKFYHIICWGIPFVSVVLCFAFGRYADVGPWCFLVPDSLFRLFYYVPLTVVFLVNFGVFIAVRLRIAQHKYSIEARMNVMVSFYLVAFLASQMPSLTNGLQNFFQPDNPVWLLYIFQALFQPMQGFFNCLVYGKNEGFVALYVRLFEKYFFKCRKGIDYEQDGVDTEGLLVEYDYHSDDE